jgi:16S rRNA U516 pseudouridylate synthase RsuA-like enzyme
MVPTKRERESQMTITRNRARRGAGPELHFTLADGALREVQHLSAETGYSVGQLIQISLGLLKVVTDANRAHHQVVVLSHKGELLETIGLPSA